ncbi:MAG: hypothetical protein WDM87_15805 [Terracidiphilus sp.]
MDDTPWVHLDVAGVALLEESMHFAAKGPTGFWRPQYLEWVRLYEKES